MINFLRKIRRNLLSENKYSNYFIYAIGEIMLVVIGIFLALQIDNWNEDRVNQNELNSILSTIIINLESDIANMDNDSGNDDFAPVYFKKALSDPEGSNTEDFIKNLQQPYFPLDNSGYQIALSNNKINLIKNNQLKLSLISYYEWDYLDNLRFIDYIFDVYSNIQTQTFSSNLNIKEGISFGNHVKNLIKDSSYREMINSYIRLYEIVLEKHDKRIIKAKDIITMINEELKR